ncbi:hypothetical protein PS2_035964 [Malus domestica]
MTALGSTIHQFKIKPRRPLKKVFIRSSSVHPKIKPQRPFGSTNVDKAIHPTVLQDQAQKPLKIRSSPFFKIKPQRPLKKHSSSRSSPNGSLKIAQIHLQRSSPKAP